MVDKELAKKAVRDILIAIGEDPDREGLLETPDRVARMYEEVFSGVGVSNDEIAERFGKCFTCDSDEIVTVRNIECFSYCEHHLALMYDMRISVAYKPKGKVIGLSKVARIADLVCKRPQIQERITSDIYEVMRKALGTDDVAVFVSGKHSCMTARGIKNSTSDTKTHKLGGIFLTEPSLRVEVMGMLSD